MSNKYNLNGLKVCFIAILFFSFINIAYAESNRLRTEAAIGFLMSGEQKLTKSEYDTFWKMMPPISAAEKSRFIEFIKPDLVDGLEYQRNLWICAKEAWITKRTPNCESAFKVFDRMLKKTKSQGLSVAPMMDSLENSKRLLSASASRSVLKGYDGKEVSLSLDLISSTINTMDVKFSRVRDGLRESY